MSSTFTDFVEFLSQKEYILIIRSEGGGTMEQLYKNIKARRVELGLTQQELAEKMGYTNRSSIAKIENGAVDLSQSKIIQFAKVLETTPGALMGSADHEELINPQSEHQEYYEDETVRAVTDRLRKNPEYSVMFKAASNVKPEDIDFVTQFIEKMSN